MTQSIQPFEIRVDDVVLDDLRARLWNTRWPAAPDDPGWAYGIEDVRAFFRRFRDGQTRR
jgi:hypothetical protein